MKAITKTKYGGPEVLKLEELEKPSVKAGHLLVGVKANSANPADWHIIRGEPFFARFAFGLFKPKDKIPGADFAGVVEEVGDGVKGFAVGDRVFGESLMGGAFAEYISASADACAKMPIESDFKEMAALPIAGVTALQALIDHGKFKKGQSVLINGSSGGVGHFAVQIAKALGAEVTGVCSSRNVDFISELGADHAIAYDIEDLRQHKKKYDLVLDAHGNLSFGDFKRLGRRGVVVGFTSMKHMSALLLSSALSKFPLDQFTAKPNTADLETLAAYVKDGRVKVHFDKVYAYKDIPEAIAYIEKMHTRGKVVMEWAALQ